MSARRPTPRLYKSTPRGVHVKSERHVAIFAAVSRGLSHVEVGRLFGVKPATVGKIASEMREAREDARALALLGKGDAA